MNSWLQPKLNANKALKAEAGHALKAAEKREYGTYESNCPQRGIMIYFQSAHWFFTDSLRR